MWRLREAGRPAQSHTAGEQTEHKQSPRLATSCLPGCRQSFLTVLPVWGRSCGEEVAWPAVRTFRPQRTCLKYPQTLQNQGSSEAQRECLHPLTWKKEKGNVITAVTVSQEGPSPWTEALDHIVEKSPGTLPSYSTSHWPH